MKVHELLTELEKQVQAGNANLEIYLITGGEWSYLNPHTVRVETYDGGRPRSVVEIVSRPEEEDDE